MMFTFLDFLMLSSLSKQQEILDELQRQRPQPQPAEGERWRPEPLTAEERRQVDWVVKNHHTGAWPFRPDGSLISDPPEKIPNLWTKFFHPNRNAPSMSEQERAKWRRLLWIIGLIFAFGVVIANLPPPSAPPNIERQFIGDIHNVKKHHREHHIDKRTQKDTKAGSA